MGLIDSTNRVERALVSAKVERRAEREKQRQERKLKAELKAELAGAEAQATEELRSIITNMYELLGYEQASVYFKSLKIREQVINKITQNEAIKQFAFNNYYKVLKQIDKEQKNNFEFIKKQAEELSEEEKKKQVETNATFAVTKLLLAILRTLAGALFLLVLTFTGVVDIANAASKPHRRYRR